MNEDLIPDVSLVEGMEPDDTLYHYEHYDASSPFIAPLLTGSGAGLLDSIAPESLCPTLEEMAHHPVMLFGRDWYWGNTVIVRWRVTDRFNERGCHVLDCPMLIAHVFPDSRSDQSFSLPALRAELRRLGAMAW